MRQFQKWFGCMMLCLAAVLLGLLLPRTVLANAHDDYKELVVDIENEGPPQQIQLYRVDSNGDRITGICNVCSITTLLNRRLAYDGRTDQEFTIYDVFEACGVTVKSGPSYWNEGRGKTGFVYSGDTGFWSRLKYQNDWGTTYQAVRVSVEQIKQGVSEAGNFSNYLIKLLHQHPEGICIRNEGANHVAVIYYYTMVDGKAQFYVKDPVDRYSGKVEDAWIYNANQVYSLYNGIDFIVYLKGSRPAPEPDDSCLVQTALSRGSSGQRVRTMQTMLKAVMGSDMEVDGYFGPGTEALLERFQRSVGLEDDGYCGKGTWAKLQEAYEKWQKQGSQSQSTPETTTAPTEEETSPQETQGAPETAAAPENNQGNTGDTPTAPSYLSLWKRIKMLLVAHGWTDSNRIPNIAP